MFDSLVSWSSDSAAIVFVRDSKYGMPAVQSVHLIGITVFLAAILLLNVRLAGMGMLDSPLPWLERQLRPWAMGAVAVAILSGLLIFLGTPAKYLASNPFRVKMMVLGLAILFHFAVLRRFVRAERVSVVVAGVSSTLWFLIGWAGRAIAFIP